MKTILQLSILLLMLAPGLASAQATSYDADGDGTPDSTDQCAFVKGGKTDKGCPAPKRVTADDGDGDGITDAKDKCADMYGVKEAQGCPNLLMASATGQQMFTVESSTSTEESDLFKKSLTGIIAEADRGATPAKVPGAKTDGQKTETAKCLPGATCYIQNNDSKTFYADFGQYSTEADAAQRYYMLKNKLLEVLSKQGYTGNEVAKGGYIDKYEMTRAGATTAPVIATHVKRVNDTYSVYLTVAEK